MCQYAAMNMGMLLEEQKTPPLTGFSLLLWTGSEELPFRCVTFALIHNVTATPGLPQCANGAVKCKKPQASAQTVRRDAALA